MSGTSAENPQATHASGASWWVGGGIIGLLLVLALVLLTTRTFNRTAIESVLAEDEALEAQVEVMAQQGQSPATIVAWYVQQLRLIDTRSCPKDFRDAFLRH